MFNIGGDDKEKLEENMEEIKQLVNDGGDNPEADQTDIDNSQEPDEAPDLQDAVNENFQQQQGEDQSHEEFGQDPGLNQPNDAQDQDIQGMQEDLEEIQQQVQGEPQENQQGPQNQDIPETQHEPQGLGQQPQQQNTTQPAETKVRQEVQDESDINELKDEIEGQISEVKEGRTSRNFKEDVEKINQKREEEAEQERKEQPLFLEVDKFEDIQDMVEEMHYLATEMDDVMEHLVVGIEEDQETMGEASQIIDEFQHRKEKIETTLKDN